MVMYVRCPDRLPEETYRQVLEEMAELSPIPIVQALPLTAALMELKGALRYHRADARQLGEVLRVRTLFRLGVDFRIGIGPSITVAATASSQISAPGGLLAVAPDQVADWLGPLPPDRPGAEGRGLNRRQPGRPADQPRRHPRGPAGGRSGHRPRPRQVRCRRHRSGDCLPPRLVTRRSSRGRVSFGRLDDVKQREQAQQQDKRETR
ncbi:hypothetical protein [Streptomyces sp. IBSBF 2806]|uniref:hypothetical protein n=1 Tax=Streptomyces sp. IBSBF 2806 TaxID=2903529 RepID=UPI002FDC50B0